MKFMKKNGGFTLVELIVVIAILAILAGVAVPAYSGYITKAEEAADQQLLGAVNTAFAAACLSENLQPKADIQSASLVWSGNAVSGVSTGNSAVDEAFQMFYQGNTGAEFKVLARKLVYQKANGIFVEMSKGMSALMDILTQSYGGAIDALKGSAFNEMGYDVLAGKIDNASELLAGFYGNPDSGFGMLLGSEENEKVLMGYLSENEEEATLIFDSMLAAKLEAIENDPRYDGMTDVQKGDLAYGQLYANAAILTAAKNPDAIDKDFVTALQNGTAVNKLMGATGGGAASADTISQAAFAYAMYTSYQKHAGKEITEDVDINDVYATLGTKEFQDYMKNDSAADQEGYKGAMTLIAGSADNADSDLAKDILQNGFNSDELVALIQGATK